MENERIYIYKKAEALAESVGSLYRDTRKCRDDLLNFFIVNEWFGQTLEGNGDDIYIRNSTEITERLSLWLMAYRRTNSEKTDILIERFSERYPITCAEFGKYFKEAGTYGSEGSLRILDYLLSEIDRELTDYTEEEAQGIIANACDYLAISNCDVMIDFMKSLKGKGKLRLDWEYEIHSRRLVERDNTAYPLKDFSFMAYILFNEKAWYDRALVEKALHEKKYADMWLYISLHFVCGLRSTDLERLPAPELPYERKLLMEKIADGDFRGKEAVSLVEHWEYLAGMTMGQPNKTGRFSLIPDVKFFVAESLKEPIGIMLAIALSHHEKGDKCIRPAAEISHIKAFLGDDFAEVAGKRRFMTRRANKAYIQGIEATAEVEPGSAKGYMLAALARSHKGGIGELAEMTEVYLRDAAFTGYKPDFILREMFERGIFGFIPALLLNEYCHEDYRKLGVSGQTKIIKMIGLSPMQLESIVSSIDRSMDRAEKAVGEILSMVDNSKEAVHKVLQNLCAGEIPAKQEEMLCLRFAAGLPCCHSDRGCCMGCGFEIYTKTAFHILMQEYVFLSKKRGMTDGMERARLSRIMSEGILPAVSQILASMEMLYPKAEMESMLKIMERGIDYAAAGE